MTAPGFFQVQAPRYTHVQSAPQGAARRADPDGNASSAGGCLFGALLLATVITGTLTLSWGALWLGALPASLAAAGWVPVPGVLTQATYWGDCNARVRGGGPTPPLSLSYVYAYAGTAYTGHLLGPTHWHHFHRADCGRGVPAELPAPSLSTRVTVYVNTTSPIQAALDRSLPSFGKTGRFLLAFVPLLLLSLWILRRDRKTPRPYPTTPR